MHIFSYIVSSCDPSDSSHCPKTLLPCTNIHKVDLRRECTFAPRHRICTALNFLQMDTQQNFLCRHIYWHSVSLLLLLFVVVVFVFADVVVIVVLPLVLLFKCCVYVLETELINAGMMTQEKLCWKG